MKKSTKRILAVIMALALTAVLFAGYACFADGEEETNTAVTVAAEGTVDETAQENGGSSTSSKAVAAAACLAAVAAVGAIAMGFAISKSTDGISRQPEADGKIRTTLMLGLVFIETLVIYALVLAILIIFVL